MDGGKAWLSVSDAGAVEGVPRQVRGGSDGGAWRALLARLRALEWVVYAKQPLGGPAQVLEYLARYTHRVAISNERIVGMDEREVRFRVRSDATSGRKRTLRLPAAEFIDRFLKHVLPTAPGASQRGPPCA
jgi:Putative transposase